MAKAWKDMDAEEKLDALRKDVGETAAFVNRLAADIRELNSRLSVVAEETRALRKTGA